MQERIIGKRVLNVFLMFVITITAIGIIGYEKTLWLDQLLSVILICITFFVLFLFVLEHHRAMKLISNNAGTDFRKVLKGYLIAAIAAVVCAAMP